MPQTVEVVPGGHVVQADQLLGPQPVDAGRHSAELVADSAQRAVPVRAVTGSGTPLPLSPRLPRAANCSSSALYFGAMPVLPFAKYTVIDCITV